MCGSRRLWLRWLSLLALLGFLTALVIIFAVLYRPVPSEQGVARLRGLVGPVSVAFDEFGVPSIRAATTGDAYRALGFVTARDRLFQMDLLRRASGGSLAEVMGAAMLDSDRRHRVLGFRHVAARIVAGLPGEQRQALMAYAEGVNEWIAQADSLPFEFAVLGYRPLPWAAEDSVLVLLGVFEGLDESESEERMLTVMAQTLPPDVVAFLTPRVDPWRSRLPHHDPLYLPPRASPIPIESLKSLLQSGAGRREAAALLGFHRPRPGSNAWAVAGGRTADARALLANDMHIGLAVPNIWYRYAVVVDGRTAAGVGLPGIPLLVAGATDALAWGLTNLGADLSDLVVLDVDPQDPGRYRGPAGWRRFDETVERVHVKGEADVEFTVRGTIWGPVSEEPLLGRSVAVRWTGLDPAAVDLGLLNLDRAATVADAVQTVNRAGGPPLNVVLADVSGRIAWTVTGRIPKRRGFDGATSRAWASGEFDWLGYVEPEQLPRLIEPDAGLVVSANDKAFPENIPYGISHGFDNGYRAFRIKQQLRDGDGLTTDRMRALQLDTRTEFYDVYRDLALVALSAATVPLPEPLRRAQQQLLAWDGKAESDSVGFGLLVEFRRWLLKQTLGPVLQPCRERDAAFEFTWPHADVPLQALLREQPLGVFPGLQSPEDWSQFVRDGVEASLRRVEAETGQPDPRWGSRNRVQMAHPFSAALPWLSPLLDMPRDALPGCEFCVRFALEETAATERFVVSPGRLAEGLMQMPGGQSGHPLSRHYRDQQEAWLKGLPRGFLNRPIPRGLQLEPVPPGRRPSAE